MTLVRLCTQDQEQQVVQRWRKGADSSLRARVEIQTSAEVSYAVAIYPYMAEQEDEFDVVVCVLPDYMEVLSDLSRQR